MVKKSNKAKDEKLKDPLQHAMQTFESTTKTPTDYLKEQKDFAQKNLSLLKSLFDYAKTSGTHFQSNNVPDEIYIDHMDDEQIWQQLEVQNDSFWEKCMTQTCRLLSLNENKLTLKVKSEEEEELDEEEAEQDLEQSEQESEQESEQSDAEVDDQDDEDGSDGSDGENDDKSAKPKANKSYEKSVLDDKFFNMNEMEAFLDNEDKKELDRLNGKRNKKDDDDSEEEIDYFDSLSDSEDSDEDEAASSKGNGMMFSEFFDEEADEAEETPEQYKQRKRAEREEKNKRKAHEKKQDLGLEDSEEEDGLFQEGENEDENDENGNDREVEKSEFDLRQHRLQKRIEDLEEDALGEKPWQLKGEITSAIRPKNSLLEEVLEFDSVARPAPLITEETTLCLEDIIKRRIKSKAWDDVERNIKPINDQQDFRKSLVLQQDKSKESLAQIYEKEYLEKVHKMNNVDDTSKADEPAEHTEIRKSIKDLFIKLDALSNFHFTSKPVAAEAKIITNIPAIEMEEVAPVAVSDATLLAPEEVRARPIGDEIGTTERTNTDKKRERRKKKLKQKLIKQRDDKRIEEKEKLGIKVTTKEKQQQLMNQVTKSRNVIKGTTTSNVENKALKSSKTFFTQLQDNISSAVKSKGKSKSATDLSKHESNAKRFKL